MKIRNPPAFPRAASFEPVTGHERTADDQEGMDLRDWFAGQVLRAVATDLGVGRLRDVGDNTLYRWCEAAYRVADQMLRARDGAGPVPRLPREQPGEGGAS